MNESSFILTLLVWGGASFSNLLYYLLPPLTLYLFSWQKLRMKKIHAVFIAIFIGYIFGVVSVGFKWAYIDEYYYLLKELSPDPSITANTEDSNFAAWLVLGWVPTTVYVTFCWLSLHILRKRNII